MASSLTKKVMQHMTPYGGRPGTGRPGIGTGRPGTKRPQQHLQVQEQSYPALSQFQQEYNDEVDFEDGDRFLPTDNEHSTRNPSSYDDSLMQQPVYDVPQIQIMNDIASDESFPMFVNFIENHSRLGNTAKARILVRAAAFLSKNQVFSNIVDLKDYLMATDDFAYATLLEKADFVSYDMNAEYFEGNALLEATFNIRLRRSRNALNLLQINTHREESIYPVNTQMQEQQRLRNKIPFIGSHL
jgi:hypothetical protein